MGETIGAVFSAPLANILVIAGIVFLLIAVLGAVAGKIDPGKWGRIAAGSTGLVLLVAGLSMHLVVGKINDTDQKGEGKESIIHEESQKAMEEARQQALEEARRKAAKEAHQQGPYKRMDFGYNGCDAQFGELKKGVSEADMVRFATAAGAKGFTYHPSLKYGKIMIGEYPQGCKSSANMSWPLFLKTELEAKRKASEGWTIPDTKSSFVEKNGHLVSVTNGNPLCPTPPGWRTGCYAISSEHRQNWHNTPDGYVANGKKVKTFSNRSERVFDIPGTKLSFYVDDGHLFFYPTATILCPWPKAGAAKCHKIETKYEDKWRNTTEGFIANGREFDAIEVMRDVRQGLF